VRWAFYPDAVAVAVAVADEDAMGVIAPGVARFSEPGFGRAAASKVDVPIFLAFGELRDIAADPHLEPSFYPHTRDVTLHIVPDSAHCHNFAPSRRRLWERLALWTAAVAAETSGGA
jgi:hypothetical protein